MNEKCHLIGVGGIGMSGLARILLARKHQVSGSDLTSNAQTASLASQGVTIYRGHAASNVPENATVIYTTGVPTENPEFATAQKYQCRLIHRSDMLLELMEGYKTLAVTGTHGKTTTSALLTWVLVEAEWDPSFAVGGVLSNMQVNAGHGEGEYFVAEADESDNTFLKYSPHAAIVTNIGLDHMPTFETEEKLIDSFREFCEKTDRLFWCGDDTRLRQLNPVGFSYGFGKNCALRISDFRQNGWNSTFSLDYQGKKYEEISLSLIGLHNAYNAAAVFGLAISLGIPEEVIRRAFTTFKGIARRCEQKGEVQGVLFLDDYAHHTTEIKTTLKAIREASPERRIIALFQPHRFTRTRDCLGSYRGAFDAADLTLVTDIYTAGEDPIPGITPEAILAETPGVYLPRSKLTQELLEILRPHDLLVTLGAGDITYVCPEILEQLKTRKIQKYRVGILCGGRSAEHEISQISAKFFMESLNPEYYTMDTTIIPKEGAMFTVEKLRELMGYDILIPVLHGPFGEDGTIQGLFEMLDKPYVGPDHRSAAVCMDKVLTKKILLASGLPTPPFAYFSDFDWKQDPNRVLAEIRSSVQFPLFIKAAHLGSSIGVIKVSDPNELSLAIEETLHHDTLFLAEEGIMGRELEFAVLGNDRIRVFPPGEILTHGAVYDYEAKYGENSMQTTAQADLEPEVAERGMDLAEQAYRSVGCTGMARVDFFLDQNGKWWVNELNPIPGFTRNSLYPRICEANGLFASDLMDRLMILALERNR